MGVPTKIDRFTGEFRWLSNFWRCDIEYEGLVYPSTEHAFQAAKSLDVEVRKLFTNKDMICRHAREKGNQIELRPDWEDVKLQVMRDVNLYKFTHYPELKEWLLGTTLPLEEGNNHGDMFWGTVDFVGENHLGKILMQIRDELRSST